MPAFSNCRIEGFSSLWTGLQGVQSQEVEVREGCPGTCPEGSCSLLETSSLRGLVLLGARAPGVQAHWVWPAGVRASVVAALGLNSCGTQA